MNVFKPREHPLKSEVRRHGLRLYQLAPVLGASEATISRCLNGVQKMPEEMEQNLLKLIVEVSHKRIAQIR
jgi:hypothetical protein